MTFSSDGVVPGGLSRSDVVVVGAGIVGAAIAWRAARAGLRVTMLDPAPGSGATHAAAGMLAPVAESWFGEEAATRLGLAGLAAWPSFAADLTADTGLDVGLRAGAGAPQGAAPPPAGGPADQVGSLLVAFDADDLAELRRVVALHHELGLGSAQLTVADARRAEPLLGPRVSGAARVPADGSADPRATVAALLAALAAAPGVDVVQRAATEILVEAGRAVGVLDDAGDRHLCGSVVLAAGWRSAELAAAVGVNVPVRPVRGETLRLDAGPGETPGHVVRGIVQGRPIYVVPRTAGPDGRAEIVVGATTEESPDDGRPTAGGAFALLRDARALVPALDEAVLVDVTSRGRPGSPDNLPLVGASSLPGLVLATGHHRNGILLAPLTATAVVGLLTGDDVPPELSPADPLRFAPLPARSSRNDS